MWGWDPRLDFLDLIMCLWISFNRDKKFLCIFSNHAINMDVLKFFTVTLLIHEADPQSQPAVIIVSAHVVRPSVPFSTKQKPISSENNVRYWQDCGSWIIDDACLVSYMSYVCEKTYIWEEIHKISTLPL